MMFQKIFFTLNRAATKKKIAAFIHDKNKQFYQLSPRTYKKDCIKAPLMQTMEKIVDIYAEHLKNNAKSKIDAPFRISNGSVRLFKHNLSSRSTIYRHVMRLTQIGLLHSKIFHGSNSSYEIQINPSVLIAADNHEYNLMLLNIYTAAKKCSDVETSKMRSIFDQKGDFTAFPSGNTVSFCNHIIRLNFNNNNMKCGDVHFLENFNELSFYAAGDCIFKQLDISEMNISSLIEIEHGSKTDLAQKMSDSGAEFHHDERFRPKTGQTISAAEKPATNKDLMHFVDRALKFTMETLYPGKTYTKYSLDQARAHLIFYFTSSPSDINLKCTGVIPSQRVLLKRESQFFNRVLITYYYLKKSPDRYVPLSGPAKWLDPEFSGGFSGTMKWYKYSLKQSEKNEDFNKGKKLLASVVREYLSSPTLNNYHKGMNSLQKMKNKSFLDLYNRCVLDPSKFNHESFSQIQIN